MLIRWRAPGPRNEDDDALLMHTSGTTGKPKGCVLTHKSVCAGGEYTTAAHGLTKEDRALCAMLARCVGAVCCGAALAAATAAAFAQGAGERIAIETRTVRGPGQRDPAQIHGDLHLPESASGPVPAVVLVHGCSGVNEVTRYWAMELNRMGYGALVLDAFSGRGITEVCTGAQRLPHTNVVFDAYRALDVLATLPPIDAKRVAIMGFSYGGGVTMLAARSRYRKTAVRPGTPEPAAYLAFYPGGCNVRRNGELELAAGPLRLFHEAADNWTPVGPCRDYVQRAQAAGNKVDVVEYPGAHHAFVMPDGRMVYLPHVLNSSACTFVENADGRVVEKDSGRAASTELPCWKRGATVAPDHGARRKAVADVRAFLAEVFAAVKP